MRGFIFTIDAVSAAAFLVVLLSTAFLLLSFQAAPEKYFARDVLAALDSRALDDGQVRQLFLLSNRCGSIIVKDSAGEVLDSVVVCGCRAGTENVAYRSFVKLGAGGLDLGIAEARACERL